MNHTYFILHGRETAEVAKRLVTELHILGQTAATGPSLSRCDILVTLRSLSGDELRRSQDLAHLMVNISADTPQMGLLARGLAGMSAPLARVKNAQTSPSSRLQIALAACTAFDAVSVDVERHSILVQADTLLRAARELRLPQPNGSIRSSILSI